MTNIGYVLYKKGKEPGTLDAVWLHRETGNGTGKATGGPVDGFAGRYRMLYFDDKGNVNADRDLDIQKKGDYYELAWIDNGEITAVGIGMEVVEGLAAGWRDVDEKKG